jgi:hypothetical protein
MSRVAYIVVINDSSYESYCIPKNMDIPHHIYTSYSDAKKGLLSIITKFSEFTPVAYGSAYPYEHTTFEKEISQKEYALFGWVSFEEDGESVRIPVGLLKYTIPVTQDSH